MSLALVEVREVDVAPLAALCPALRHLALPWNRPLPYTVMENHHGSKVKQDREANEWEEVLVFAKDVSNYFSNPYLASKLPTPPLPLPVRLPPPRPHHGAPRRSGHPPPGAHGGYR